MKPLVVALLFVFLPTPGWAVGRVPEIGPPDDRPGPIIPASVPAEREVQASWQWYVGYAGFMELGPFVSAQACEAARVRFPVRYRCLPMRD